MLEPSFEHRSAFAGIAVPAPGRRSPGVTVSERVGLGLSTVTARKGQGAALAAAVRAVHSIDLPDGPKTASAGGTTFVGIGPGTWLAVEEKGGWRFAQALEASLESLATVADQSSGYGVLRLAGPRVRDVLAKGVPIDLDPAAFRPGDAAVTLASHVGIIVWQVDTEPTYDVAVFRSFAGSFWHWLDASAAEFGLAVGEPA